MLEKTLLDWAENQGFRVAWGPAAILDDVRSQFKSMSKSGDLDAAFADKMLNWVFSPDGFPVPDRKTVIVLAVPRPIHTVSFEHSGGRLEALLPPTYVDFRRTTTNIRDRLREQLFGPDCELEILRAPLKTVTARLGLSRYGRNNISYIDGLGSYYQLVGFLTNIEMHSSTEFRTHAAAQVEECKTCDRCIKACPTRAITEDRFLIHADRCLTYYNESKDPFPEDLPSTVHHCWIGCMRCQQVCPLNEGPHRLESCEVSFNREETEALIAYRGDQTDSAWHSVAKKLDLLGLVEEEVALSRNLRALIDDRAARST